MATNLQSEGYTNADRLPENHIDSSRYMHIGDYKFVGYKVHGMFIDARLYKHTNAYTLHTYSYNKAYTQEWGCT